MGVQTDGACGGVEPCDVVVACGVVVGVCLVVGVGKVIDVVVVNGIVYGGGEGDGKFLTVDSGVNAAKVDGIVNCAGERGE